MYESHFGLTGLPFQVTPDPSFVFQGKAYRGAFTALREGLAAGVKVMVVTGEPGVGKTTLVQALLSSIDPAATATLHISGSDLDAEALADRIAEASGQPRLADPLARREALLERLHSAPTPTLLVIDEAQHLGPSAFELLEALANGPATASSRLQICVLGQPELRMLLNAAEARRFRDLVGVDRHLGPLDPTEVRLYIEHRLHHAGWTGRPEFEDAAFFEIFVLTAGVPRRVNLLCNSLMLAACLEKQSRIDAPAVCRAAAAIRSDSFPAASDLTEVDLHDGHPPLPVAAVQASPSWPPATPIHTGAAVPDGSLASRALPVAVVAPLPRRQPAPPRRQPAIVASAASVAIVLTVAGVVYIVDQQSVPGAGPPVEPRTNPARRATGPVTPVATLAESPRAPAVQASAADPGVSPASAAVAAPAKPAPAEAAPEASIPVPQAPAASPTPPSCSAAAAALGLCEAESSSSTGRR